MIPVMNLTNRSPYPSGAMGEIWDFGYERPLIKCSIFLMVPYWAMPSVSQPQGRWRRSGFPSLQVSELPR